MDIKDDVHAAKFYGDGSNLTNLPGGGGGDIVSTLVHSEVTITTNTSLTAGYFYYAPSSSLQATLPSPLSGSIVGIRVGLGYQIQIQLTSGSNIDGQADRYLYDGESAILLSDGSTWSKIAGKTIASTCMMYCSTTPTISDSTETSLPLDSTVTFTPGSIEGNAGSNEIICHRTGVYQITASARWNSIGYQSTTNVTTAFVAAAINGSVQAKSEVFLNTNSSTIQMEHSITRLYSINSGDTITLVVYHNTGGSPSIQNNQLDVTEVITW